MHKFLMTSALLLVVSSALAAESVKATVGHMCCGACKASATAGVKKLDWVDGVTIDDRTLTVTAKGDQKVDLVGLFDALNKAGFPANELMVSGPVTLSVSHLCCAGCVSDLKDKLAEARSNALDKQNIKIDEQAKTVTLQPVAGQSLNLAAILRTMERAGFAASKGTLAGAAAATK